MKYLLRRAWHILVLRILPLPLARRHDLLFAIPDPWALDNQTGRYLLEDPGAAIDTLERLGRLCLIAYLDAAAPKLEVLLRSRDLLGRQTIAMDDLIWHVVWWRSPHAQVRATDETSLLACA